MSERASFRGGRGGRGGGGERRGGHPTQQNRGGAGGGGGAGQQQQEKPKKENILDLTKYMDREVNVKFNGGREGMSPPLFFFLFLMKYGSDVIKSAAFSRDMTS